jgi:hypothetical protein
VFTNNDIQLYIITSSGYLIFVNANLSTHKADKVERLFLGTFETIEPSTMKSITRSRMPSSICCNEYNIIIGYQFIEEFSLVKVCPIMTASSSAALSIQRVPFSCPNLHKIIRMQFAHETMSVCVIVQVKENDRFDLCIPIQSEYLKDKAEGVITQNLGGNTSRQNHQNHLKPPGKIFPVVFNMLLHDTLV